MDRRAGRASSAPGGRRGDLTPAPALPVAASVARSARMPPKTRSRTGRASDPRSPAVAAPGHPARLPGVLHANPRALPRRRLPSVSRNSRRSRLRAGHWGECPTRPTGREGHVDRDIVLAAQGGDRDAFAMLARVTWRPALRDRPADAPRRRPGGRRGPAGAHRRVARAAGPPGPGPVRCLDQPSAGARGLCGVEQASQGDGIDLRAPGRGCQRRRDDLLAIVDRDELERGFRRLAVDERALLVLRHYLGMEPIEIAERRSASPRGPCDHRLHHAHRAMRAALEAEERSAGPASGRQPAAVLG